MKITENGKFEPVKAVQACKNWAEVIENPLSPVNRAKEIAETFDGSTPSLATISKYQHERLSILILSKMIKDTAEFFNVGASIGDNQIKQTAVLILDDYFYLTIKDFALCFNMAKRGKFDKLYNRLDGAIVLRWLKEYSQLRFSEAQAHAEIEARKRKQEQVSAPVAEVLKSITFKAAPKKESISDEELAKRKKEQQDSIKLIYGDK